MINSIINSDVQLYKTTSKNMTAAWRMNGIRASSEYDT